MIGLDEDFSELTTIKKVSTSSGDWEGIYVNNILTYEGHEIKEFEWFELGQNNPNTDYVDMENYEIDSELMEEECYWELPEYFEDIPKDLFINN